MKNWEVDKRWSDKHLPEIKKILGLYLIGEPPQEEDERRNTDLMVLKMEAVRIGCRIRKKEWIRYRDEFTIRKSRPSGMKSEISKIIEGWGDYFFYGFGDDAGNLLAWTLADMKIFRLWFAREIAGLNKGIIPGVTKKNGDGSSDFLIFRWDDLPPNFVVAQESINLQGGLNA